MNINGLFVSICLLAGFHSHTRAVENPENDLEIDDIQAALGENHFSPKMFYLRRLLTDKPRISFGDRESEVNAFTHHWKDKGLEFRFDKKTVFVSAILHAGVSTDFKTYKGKLPKELKFSDAPTDVEKKLGMPASVTELREKGLAFTWHYPKGGLSITFAASKKDQPNPIAFIKIYPEQKASDQ